MMGKITLEKKDLLLLRVPVLCFAISAGLGVALYFAAQYLTEQASRDLFIAQTNLDQTSTSVLQIAQEEETIIRYIGRYRDIEADGGVAEEDRLRLLEVIAEIRQANLLYPIAVELSEQSSQRLEYDPAELNPADPVDLQMTEITLTLP
ncbi:MAG: hypothetical protein Q8L60_14840, partial [Gammaproteobacteria bacterium]|nr:hypothetical protein [Gammaproteobacteria bacterium]